MEPNVSETLRVARAYQRIEAGSAGRWNLDNRGNQLILAERRAVAQRLLERAGLLPLGERSVLEVGCGRGGELAWLQGLGADPVRCFGVDLLPARVAAARRAHPTLEIRVGDGADLDFPSESFDLVMAITLFSSILDRSVASAVAREIRRVLRPGGGLLFYDFRYPSPANRDVRSIGEREVRGWFGGFEGELRSVTVLPPLARRMGPLSEVAYPVLKRIPFIRSHLIGVLTKVQNDAI